MLLGGVLTRAFGWQAVFLINVPLAAGGAGAGVPAARRRRPAESGRSFDLPGALSASGGITLLVFALVQGPEPGWVRPARRGAAGGWRCWAAFVVIERRSRDPLVPPRLLANRNVVTAFALASLFAATFGSVLYFLTLYLQDVRGYDALETGMAFLLPTAVVGRVRLAGRW